MTDWQAVLRDEFEGGENSFLLLLRTTGWNWPAYHRLFLAMRDCCKAMEGEQKVERWLAEGFWYLSWFPLQEAEADQLAKRDESVISGAGNFHHLAWWFFAGVGRADDQFESVPPS